ncbi:MAG TPA: hypothetical protein VFR73_14925 [Hyphomicrobiaceae bacterium]|nr:hypothetical protein [Hyphomicrobiaceae bacterium]
MNSIASRAPAAGELTSPAHSTGLVMSALVIVLLVFDAAIQLVPTTVVTETMTALGDPTGPGARALSARCALACPHSASLVTDHRPTHPRSRIPGE